MALSRLQVQVGQPARRRESQRPARRRRVPLVIAVMPMATTTRVATPIVRDMRRLLPRAGRTVLAIAVAAAMAPAARAEMSSEELAKLAQNPVGNLISVPFQNNT